MREVLDTSVVVSGLISPHGAPARIITHWRNGNFTLLYSPAIFEELKDVLNRVWLTKKLAGVPNRIADYLEGVVILGELVVGYINVTGQVRDPFDEIFLACARLGQADYLVSVDKDLLALGQYEGTRIVTPAQFLAVLGEK
ncbi:MAG: putative toxin-antitoxin system toxin component, PIN family [Chloroflexi bacterium]|nr:putative toxin-antitoxin system toxin component, PIN family [Chloroflexota bacterium]